MDVSLVINLPEFMHRINFFGLQSIWNVLESVSQTQPTKDALEEYLSTPMTRLTMIRCILAPSSAILPE